MAEPVPFDVISARIAARQEAGRRHREVMYQRQLQKQRFYGRARLQQEREAEDIALIRRYEALKQAREACKHDLRLAEIVADQERDEQRRIVGARWLLSLDALREGRGQAEDDPNGVWNLYDVIPAPEIGA